MTQLGMVLSEDDVHAMMKSVGIGPYGKISYSGTSLQTNVIWRPDTFCSILLKSRKALFCHVTLVETFTASLTNCNAELVEAASPIVRLN